MRLVLNNKVEQKEKKKGTFSRIFREVVTALLISLKTNQTQKDNAQRILCGSDYECWTKNEISLSYDT